MNYTLKKYTMKIYSLYPYFCQTIPVANTVDAVAGFFKVVV